SDISNILNSDVSDDLKAKSYAATLSRFKSYSIPSPPQLQPPPPHVLSSSPHAPRPSRSLIKSDKRAVDKARSGDSDTSLDIHFDNSYDSTLWNHSPRDRSTQKSGTKWVTPAEKKKKKAKTRKTWVQY